MIDRVVLEESCSEGRGVDLSIYKVEFVLKEQCEND